MMIRDQLHMKTKIQHMVIKDLNGGMNLTDVAKHPTVLTISI